MKGKIVVCTGSLCLAVAFLLSSYNLLDARRAERSAAFSAVQLSDRIPSKAEETPDPSDVDEDGSDAVKLVPFPAAQPSSSSEAWPDEMPETTIDGNAYIGTLSIVDLGLDLPVISSWSYPSLRIAPCRYAGSAYDGDLIIAAHNYAAHFGGIKDLSKGAYISFKDVDGNEFHYTVTEVKTLEPTDIDEMKFGGKWDLTLFTCTVGGKARITVRCIEKQKDDCVYAENN